MFVRLPSCIPNQSIARGQRKPFRASGLHIHILRSHRHSRNPRHSHSHRHSHSRHLKLKHMKTTCLEPPFQKETGIKCYRQKRKSCLSHAYGASPHGTAVLKSHAEVCLKGFPAWHRDDCSTHSIDVLSKCSYGHSSCFSWGTVTSFIPTSMCADAFLPCIFIAGMA